MRPVLQLRALDHELSLGTVQTQITLRHPALGEENARLRLLTFCIRHTDTWLGNAVHLFYLCHISLRHRENNLLFECRLQYSAQINP